MEKISLAVLVVDKEEKNRDFLSMCIQKLGHSFKTTGSCDQALLQLSQGNFDLIFVAASLADGDGVELMRRSKELYPEISIIAMTEGVSRDEEIRIREQRVIFLLIKPFTWKEIQDILDHTAKRKRVEILKVSNC